MFQFTKILPTQLELQIKRRRISRLTRPGTLVVFFSMICLFPMQCDAQTPREISAASYLERGKGFAAKGDFGRAIAGFGIALQFDANYANAYVAGVLLV
jgi:hypothetical protein